MHSKVTSKLLAFVGGGGGEQAAIEQELASLTLGQIVGRTYELAAVIGKLENGAFKLGNFSFERHTVDLVGGVQQWTHKVALVLPTDPENPVGIVRNGMPVTTDVGVTQELRSSCVAYLKRNQTRDRASENVSDMEGLLRREGVEGVLRLARDHRPDAPSTPVALLERMCVAMKDDMEALSHLARLYDEAARYARLQFISARTEPVVEQKTPAATEPEARSTERDEPARVQGPRRFSDAFQTARVVEEPRLLAGTAGERTMPAFDESPEPPAPTSARQAFVTRRESQERTAAPEPVTREPHREMTAVAKETPAPTPARKAFERPETQQAAAKPAEPERTDASPKNRKLTAEIRETPVAIEIDGKTAGYRGILLLEDGSQLPFNAFGKEGSKIHRNAGSIPFAVSVDGYESPAKGGPNKGLMEFRVTAVLEMDDRRDKGGDER